jgi:predicted nucleotidyltransferase component of viral defense system
VIDLDYVLGWALWGLASHPYLRSRLVFKGGTCLHKCYFSDYRFSEDLDFTAVEPTDWRKLEEACRDALERVTTDTGIDFTAEDPRIEVLKDEHDRESVQMRIYYRGPHRSGASPRAIRLDVSGAETMVFDPVPRPIIHPYSDSAEMGETIWSCYSLEEMMTEKVRAVIGQRRYAISRDLYDIQALLKRGIDETRVRSTLPAKLLAKNLSSDVEADRMLSKKAEFRADWERNLISLLPPDDTPDFEDAWETVNEFLQRILSS